MQEKKKNKKSLKFSKKIVFLQIIFMFFINSSAHPQTKVEDLLQHCQAAPHGDGFCRGFVEATLDSFIFYRTNDEMDHYCLFKDPDASTDRLVELAESALLSATPAGRQILNAVPILRAAFNSNDLCKPTPLK